ncbi:MAG: hypothetical protein KatS3mg131_1776 [Candidatus Tectimicrobiota bacterium]|nr:MAG: hypothetical protein KatS3mg131_1776 [Candidatus Tectomicrobia bacterium]
MPLLQRLTACLVARGDAFVQALTAPQRLEITVFSPPEQPRLRLVLAGSAAATAVRLVPPEGATHDAFLAALIHDLTRTCQSE